MLNTEKISLRYARLLSGLTLNQAARLSDISLCELMLYELFPHFTPIDVSVKLLTTYGIKFGMVNFKRLK